MSDGMLILVFLVAMLGGLLGNLHSRNGAAVGAMTGVITLLAIHQYPIVGLCLLGIVFVALCGVLSLLPVILICLILNNDSPTTSSEPPWHRKTLIKHHIMDQQRNSEADPHF